MKKWTIVISLLLVLTAGLWIALGAAETAARAAMAEQTLHTASSSTALPETILETTAKPETIPVTETLASIPTETMPETTAPAVLTFTEEEAYLLLQIGAAERGTAGCTECIALVMRTVLNRVESPKFPSTIKGVIYAQDQFTPVMDGTFEEAVPGWRCTNALEMIQEGWDESQGALYYEWCEGESWHSQNLDLLFQHCDTRFYH